MFLKKDNLRLGIALAVITPVLVFLFLYFGRFSGYRFSEFLHVLQTEDRLITFISVWCLVANIGLFTFYTNTDRHLTARGIFIITLFYAIAFLLIKVIN